MCTPDYKQRGSDDWGGQMAKGSCGRREGGGRWSHVGGQGGGGGLEGDRPGRRFIAPEGRQHCKVRDVALSIFPVSGPCKCASRRLESATAAAAATCSRSKLGPFLLWNAKCIREIGSRGVLLLFIAKFVDAPPPKENEPPPPPTSLPTFRAQ
jgi:hypothetical protein